MGQDLKQASTLTLEGILNQLAKLNANGCLQLSYNSIIFFLYLNEGKLVYATNSLAPFERLERHLRRLSNQNTKLKGEVIKQAREKFRQVLESYVDTPSDYLGVLWLSEEQYLSQEEAVTLLRRITREVFEYILCLPDPLQYQFVEQSKKLPELCRFDLDSYIEQCQRRLHAWQTFSPHIESSFQRLYLATEQANGIANLTKEQNETICKLLKGLNFRQISAVIDKDELIVARILAPSIANGNVLARTPKPPFDRLPELPNNHLFDNIVMDFDEDWQPTEGNNSKIKSNSKQTIELLGKRWKIACVDDSMAVHKNLEELLDGKMFAIHMINDPMNALSELIEFEPALILLDVDMPNINGYELCSLLRSHHTFKHIPIVMLSGDKGLGNMTKSRLAGATDHLIKPFTQSSLFSILFRYLE